VDTLLLIVRLKNRINFFLTANEDPNHLPVIYSVVMKDTGEVKLTVSVLFCVSKDRLSSKILE
jgi:hypothetical protein